MINFNLSDIINIICSLLNLMLEIILVFVSAVIKMLPSIARALLKIKMMMKYTKRQYIEEQIDLIEILFLAVLDNSCQSSNDKYDVYIKSKHFEF